MKKGEDSVMLMKMAKVPPSRHRRTSELKRKSPQDRYRFEPRAMGMRTSGDGNDEMWE